MATMHRFYLPPERCTAPEPVLAGTEAHHALRVLRLRPGERVQVLDGAGESYQCKVLHTARSEVRLTVESSRSHPPPPCSLTLVQAVTKPRSMDWLIQKAVELGVARILPVVTARSVPRPDARAGAAKAAKWRSIAVEAMKQSGWPWLPDVAEPLPLAAVAGDLLSTELGWVAALEPGARHPRVVLDEYLRRHGARPTRATVCIGPEGDFADAELALLRDKGMTPVTLGDTVLRSETAALYCLSVLRYELSRDPRQDAD